MRTTVAYCSSARDLITPPTGNSSGRHSHRAVHAVTAAATGQRSRQRAAVAFEGLAKRERWSRADTARSFHGLLDLASLGALSVVQDAPFAPISMTIGAS